MEELEIVAGYGTFNLSTRQGSIQYIVIHYTAGVTSRAGAAMANARYYATGDRQASADYFVDDETIVQYNPNLERTNTWAVGGPRLTTSKGGRLHGICRNANSVSIEMCSTNALGVAGKEDRANSPHWSVTERVVEKTAQLTRWLMERYNIPPERVVRHYDVTGKLCPGIVGWNEMSGKTDQWLRFKSLLTEAPGYLVPANETSEEKEDEDMEKYKTLREVPEWAKPTVKKLLAAGVLKGEGETGSIEERVINVSYDLARTLVVLDRAQVFKDLKEGD